MAVHMPGGLLAGKERSLDIDGKDAIKIFFRNLGKKFRDHNPGIID
ncbi:hypothetical protein SDC9_206645 [bioreactor metagenome]|uniref:Uncharacterized protein n=1 Tax=bioreactor metagenome TaxID=1076179 RepID=A0A645J8A4_9ZZZZ